MTNTTQTKPTAFEIARDEQADKHVHLEYIMAANEYAVLDFKAGADFGRNYELKRSAALLDKMKELLNEAHTKICELDNEVDFYNSHEFEEKKLNLFLEVKAYEESK